MRIVGISGSLRAGSSNHALLRMAPLLIDSISLTIYDGLARLPHFSPDLEADPPAEVRAFRELVKSANGVIISSPEYVHGIPGSLKNALDWLVSSGEFINKPLVLWSASPSGAEFAHPQLLEICRTMTANVLVEASMKIPRARQAFDADGRLINEQLRRDLSLSLAALVRAASQEPEAAS
jgi:NAD(P)H-dependent FMN reductase